MQLTKIYEEADRLAPFSLSKEFCEKYEAYDNSGILVDCKREIKRILFSLDLSKEAVLRAKEENAQLIFTHHPAIYSPLKHLTEEEGAVVLFAAQNGLSVLSAHLNLDVAQGGIDDCLMEGLGGKNPLYSMKSFTGGSYGKVFEREEIPLNRFVKALSHTFETERVIAYGNNPVKRIASFCGAGMDSESVAFAKKNGADTFVSSDGKHHLISEAVESGMNVVLLPHYAAENYGFYRFYQKMKINSGADCVFFADERYL